MAKRLEQNEHQKPLSLAMITASAGFFGGVFWSFIGLIAYFFHFTEIRPNLILEPWTVGDWKTGWLGTVISLIFIGLIGIAAAFLYAFTLKKFKSFWVSILYGAVLFAIVFLVLNPLFPSLNPITELKRDTIITTLCLYILFGVFVGYSISYEYNEQKVLVEAGKREDDQLKTI